MGCWEFGQVVPIDFARQGLQGEFRDQKQAGGHRVFRELLPELELYGLHPIYRRHFDRRVPWYECPALGGKHKCHQFVVSISENSGFDVFD